jgi:hypothetical protein
MEVVFLTSSHLKMIQQILEEKLLPLFGLEGLGQIKIFESMIEKILGKFWDL